MPTPVRSRMSNPRFAGNESPVSGVVCLKEWTSKTHVYRLELGPKYTVIAKRKPHRDHLEIKMYNHILPLVGVAVPEVFGELIPRGDEGYWLFMEDLGDERPSTCLALTTDVSCPSG